MRKSALLLLFSVATFCLGQSKLQLGIMYSPDIIFRTLRADPEIIKGSPSSVEEVISRLNGFAATQLGHTAGINLRWNFHQNWNLTTGVWTSLQKEGTKRLDYDIFPSRANDPEEIIARNLFLFLDLPLVLSRSFGTGSVRPFISTGVIGHLILGYQTNSILFYENGDVIRERFPWPAPVTARSSVSVTFSGGADIAISPKTHLRVGPSFRRMLRSINPEGGEILSYLSNASLETELVFNL